MSEFNLKSGNSTPFKMMGSSPVKQTEDEGTKHLVSKQKYGEWGSSGGHESTEFVKGGRSTDKMHKSTKLTKTEPTTEKYRGEGESDKPTYTQTKTRKVRGLEAALTKKKKGDVVSKTKVISEKKYRKKLARKTAKSIRRGSDVEEHIG